jgi:large subunit ribosomal protein L10
MAKELKQLIVEELSRRYKDVDRCVVVNILGVSAVAADEIRSRLRASGVSLETVKNSLMARALARVGLEKMTGLLRGPCALATGAEDVVQLAKTVSEMAARNKNFVIRGGYTEGRLLDTGEVRRFATIPPRLVLVAQFAGVAQGPLRAIVGTLGALVRNFVGAIDAVARKRGEAEQTRT